MAKVTKGKPYPMFEAMCRAHQLPEPTREVLFHPTRKWRFDFGWWTHFVALEIEGGAFKGKGHRSVGQFLSDMEKYNEAQLAGWVVLRCTTDNIKSGAVFTLLKRGLT